MTGDSVMVCHRLIGKLWKSCGCSMNLVPLIFPEIASSHVAIWFWRLKDIRVKDKTLVT